MRIRHSSYILSILQWSVEHHHDSQAGPELGREVAEVEVHPDIGDMLPDVGDGVGEAILKPGRGRCPSATSSPRKLLRAKLRPRRPRVE